MASTRQACATETESAEFLRGEACIKAKQYISAVRHLNIAINAEPDSVHYHYVRGIAYLQLKCSEEALYDLQFCHKHAPGLVIEAKYWAQAYRAAGQFEESIKQWDEAIKADPNSLDLYYGRAQTLVEDENYARAVDDYSAAIKLDPANQRFYKERAQCYVQLKQFDKALPDLNQTIEKDSNNIEAFLHRALCYVAMAKYKEAINDYNRAIKMKPREPKVYAWRAKAYDKIGRKDLAEKDRMTSRALGEEFSF